MHAATALVWTVLGAAFTTTNLVAAKSEFGGACSRGNNHLDQNTFNFITDCEPQLYCAENNTCAHKGCRRDVFPYGYNYVPFDQLPPLCGDGQFCPDEGDRCLPQAPAGQACQKDRDDECQHPSNWRDLSGWLNTNGSICLNYVCQYANVTLGQTCILDNTPYVGYSDSGQEYAFIVSRDNCIDGLYCDGSSKQCLRTKAVGSACAGNKECRSYNCLGGGGSGGGNGTCARAAAEPVHPPVYSFVLVGIGIAVVIVGVFISLWFMHRRQRNENQRRLEQYWNEQTAYRQGIMTMSHAKNALLSDELEDMSKTQPYAQPGRAHLRDPHVFADAEGDDSPDASVETYVGTPNPGVKAGIGSAGVGGGGGGGARASPGADASGMVDPLALATAPTLLHSPAMVRGGSEDRDRDRDRSRRNSEAQWSEGGSEVLLVSPDLGASPVSAGATRRAGVVYPQPRRQGAWR